MAGGATTPCWSGSGCERAARVRGARALARGHAACARRRWSPTWRSSRGAGARARLRRGRGAAAARRHGAGAAGARAGARRGRRRAAVRRRGREGGRGHLRAGGRPTARTRSTSWPRCRCSRTATSRARATSSPPRSPGRPPAAPEGRQVVVRAVIETCYLEPAAWRLAARMAARRRLRRRRLRHRASAPRARRPRRSRRCAPSCRSASVVKAQGGIRSLADAQRALDAGADLLGVTDPASLLAELAAAPPARRRRPSAAG